MAYIIVLNEVFDVVVWLLESIVYRYMLNLAANTTLI